MKKTLLIGVVIGGFFPEMRKLRHSTDLSIVASVCLASTAFGQPITKGELVLDGVPEVPAELKERIDPYLDSRLADLTDLSADGRSLLVGTRFAETTQLHLVRGPMGMRKQLTFRPDPVVSAEFMPGSNNVIAYQSDRGGNENYQIYLLDLAKAETTMLTDGKSRNLQYLWANQGDRIYFTSNARNGKDMDLWVTHAGTKKAELFLERAGHWDLLDVSRDDRMLLIREVISIEDSRLYSLEVATKKLVRLSPEQRASYRSARFGSGNTVYVTTDREGEFVELYQTDREGKTWKPLTRYIPWNVEQMSLSSDMKTLAFSTNEGGISVLHLLSTATGKEKAEKSIPAGVIYDVKFARKANVLGLSITSATETMDVYTFDLAKRKLTRWSESEIGGLDPKTFVSPSLIEFESFDGKKIPAFYFAPQNARGPVPVVIDIHGGPEAQARLFFNASRQYLVTRLGAAVLVPNVRGSDGYGKSYLALDNGMKRMDSVKDIGALLDWIGKNPALDSKRVAVIGGSYGGFMVLASLSEYGARLRAGISIVGISNFVTFLEKTSEYRRDLRRVEYGDERDPKMRKLLLDIAPSNNAKKIRSRLFVAQGANDPRVPAFESEQIVKAVRSLKNEVWYLLAKNEGHGFARKENRDLFVMLSVMFLEKHLLPATPSG